MSLRFANEFFFTGAAILPGFLAWAGEPGLAILAFVALLLAGAVCALADPEAPFREADRERDR